MHVEDGFDPDIQFDPLIGDDTFDEEEEVAFIGLIEKPEERMDSIVEESTITPKERIHMLLNSIPGQKKVMLAIIDFCRSPQTASAVDEFTLKLQENYVSVYTPVILRQHLETAGALFYQEAQSDAQQPSDYSDTPQAPQEKVSESKNSVEVATDSAERLLQSDTERTDSIDSDVPQIEYLEVSRRPEGLWVSTEDALEIYGNLDYAGDLRRMLEEEPEYLRIYASILRFCDGVPRTKAQLNDLVDNDPLVIGPPRLYSGHFIDQLEQCGVLEFASGWKSTKTGHDFLEELDAGSTQKSGWSTE